MIRAEFAASALLTAGSVLRDGTIRPAELPGLGVELDVAAARRLEPRGPAPLPRLRRRDGSVANW